MIDCSARESLRYFDISGALPVKAMISFYRITFVVSLVVALISCFLMPSTGIPIERKLSIRSDDWSFTFHTPDRRLMGMDESGAKSLLLAFIHINRNERIPVRGVLTITCLTASLFTFIGWRRELYLEKRANGAPLGKEEEQA